MNRWVKVGILMVVGLAFTVPALSGLRGTQDFILINHTGTAIYRLFLSETTNDDWEEDILGEDVLLDGGRLPVTFSGRSACLWDILAQDSEENELGFSAINLCEASVVALRCNDEECWAELE